MEENKNIENVTEKKSAPAEPHNENRFDKEKLKALASNIKDIEKNSAARRLELEKSLSESSEEAERRIAERKAELEKNGERVEKIANEHRARLEYSGEYQRLSRRKAEKLERDTLIKEREEKQAELERETARQVDEYRKKEAEEAEARRRRTAEILKKLGEASEAEEAEKTEVDLSETVSEEDKQESDCAENVTEASLCEKTETGLTEEENNDDAASEEKAECVPEQEPENEPEQEPQDEPKEESVEKPQKNEKTVTVSEKDGKILLNFGDIKEPEKTGSVSCGDDNIIRFDGFVAAYPIERQPQKKEEAKTPDIQKNEPYQLPLEEIYRESNYYTEDVEHYPPYAPDKDVAEYESERSGASYDDDEGRMLSDFEDELEKESARDDNLLRRTMDGEPVDSLGYPHKDMHAFSKLQLLRHLNKNHAEQRKLLKKIRLAEKEQRYAAHDKNIILIVEKIGLQKEIVEIASESLISCVYVSDNGKIQRCKKELISEIENYNQLCDEYEQSTGKTVQYISVDRAEDIIAGRQIKPIPNVFYVGDYTPYSIDSGAQPSGYEGDALWGLELSDDEYEAAIGAGVERPLSRRNQRILKREREYKIATVKTAVERDLMVIGLRYEYKIAKFEEEKDLIYNSYTVNLKRKDKALSVIDKKINKQKRLAARALKLERDDNARYYSLALLESGEERIQDGADLERLNALRMRLEILLSEREVVNEELIALYGGSDKKLTLAKINRKAASIRKKHARAAYRNQRKIAEKMQKYRAPDEMKDKALSLLNKKTEAIAAIEEMRYRMNALRLRGKAQKEMWQKIRREKLKIKRINQDIRFVIGKLRRHEERSLDDMQWAITLISIAAFVIACIGVYTFFGEEIKAFFFDFYHKYIINK